MNPTDRAEAERLAEAYATRNYDKFVGKYINEAWAREHGAFLAGYTAGFAAALEKHKILPLMDEGFKLVANVMLLEAKLAVARGALQKITAYQGGGHSVALALKALEDME